MGERGGLVGLAMAVVVALGCGEAEEACFDGPSITVTSEFRDFLSWEVALEGVEMCLVMGERVCGCERSDSRGWAETALPEASEITVRFAAPGYVTLYGAMGPIHDEVHLALGMVSRQLGAALAQSFGQALDSEGAIVTVEAAPVPGFTLEGCTAELLDSTGAPVTAGAGPFYINGSTNQPEPFATAGVGERLFAVWLNVPPGTYLGRGVTPGGESLYDRCSALWHSGWVRDLDGQTVLETPAFADAGHRMVRRDCEP
jgi:hypothetical protein